MDQYAKDVPLWKRIWQNSLTQMLLLSVQAFCGPAMADAIAGKNLIIRAQSITANVNIIRSRWRGSSNSTNVKHRYCHKLHHASHLLCSRRTYRQQARHKVVAGYRCLLVPHPRLFILLQLQVRKPMVSHPRRLLHRYRYGYLVCRRVRNHHVAGTIKLSWKVSCTLDRRS